MLADVVEMPGPALLAVHLEAHEGARLPALLSRGASVSEGIGEPLELWLMLALAYLSVLRRSMALFESLQRPHTKTPYLNHCSLRGFSAGCLFLFFLLEVVCMTGLHG